MSWFEKLTGFPELSADDVRNNLKCDGTRLISFANHQTFEAGDFSTPTLANLRSATTPQTGFQLSISELVGDIRSIHQDEHNADAVIQVASQFNCLEMAAPDLVPEDGVGIYEYDLTQGPACAICAGAGTIYRNYFVDMNGSPGQRRDQQIDCLSELSEYFGGDRWTMENGYCFPTLQGLTSIENQLARCNEQELDLIRGMLKVGVQSKTQVTLDQATHLVTQVFCSGLPISYSEIPASRWNHFPQLILDATYEATFRVALANQEVTGCNKLFLTLIGGGVFGNELDWILSAIRRSLNLFASANLDVSIVSRGSSKPELARLLSLPDG